MSTSYPTPLYSHAGRGDFREVYEPAEDSFLLIDALEKDADRLQQMRLAIDRVLFPVDTHTHIFYQSLLSASSPFSARVYVWRWAVAQEWCLHSWRRWWDLRLYICEPFWFLAAMSSQWDLLM